MTAVVQASAPAVTGLVPRGFLARLIRRPMGAIGLGMLVVAGGTGLVESLSARVRMNAVPQFLLSGTALATIALLLGLR